MNLSTSPNLNQLWANLMVEELIRCGVTHFCIAPGSRSSALAVAAGQNIRAQSVVHFDERGLGYLALGMAAAERKPTAVITTSGTAAANLFPAVVEASKKKLPLIVLTADRPPELRQTGAMQTIEQTGLFGNYVRWQTDIPCPTEDISPSYVLTTVDQAVFLSQGPLPGPVHLNCMYREPLSPQRERENFTEYCQPVTEWLNGKLPYTQYLGSKQKLDHAALKRINEALHEIQHGVIAVGKLGNDRDRRAVLLLAQRLNWPIFADITSGLRTGKKAIEVVGYFDQILLSPKGIDLCRFDGVLHLGGRMTSKRWYQLIEHLPVRHHITVLSHPLRNDPLHKVTMRIQSPVGDFCEHLLNEPLPVRKNPNLTKFKKISQVIDRSITEFMAGHRRINEAAAARLIAQHVPKQAMLFLGNSMPVRDMDMFAGNNLKTTEIHGNRGASGIDGNIAATVGLAMASHRPVTAVIGDLAALYDVNSFALVKQCRQPLIFIVINNRGGGIFSFLPIAQFPQVFETFFIAPHEWSFGNIAQTFGLHYANPKSPSQFVAEYHMALVREKSTIIEVPSDRAHNVAIHEQLQQSIVSALNHSL